MPHLRFEREWDSQPEYPVALDASNALCKGIIHAINPGLGISFDATGKQIVSDTSTPEVSIYGKARKFVRGSTQVLIPNSSGKFSGYTSVSGFIQLRMDNISGTNYDTFASCRTAGNVGFTWGVYSAAGAAPNRTFKPWFVIQGVAAYVSTVDHSGFDGLFGTLGFSANSNGTVRFFANGRFVDAVAVGGFTDPGTQNATIGSQGPSGVATTYLDALVPACNVWVNRFLSDLDHQRIHANSWQLFEPEVEEIYFSGSSAVIGSTTGRVGLIGSAAGQKISTAQTTGTVRTSAATAATKIATGSATGLLQSGAATVASKIATGSAIGLLQPGASTVASKIIPASTVGLIALRGAVVGAQIGAGVVVGGASGRAGLIGATAGQKIAAAQTIGSMHARGAAAASKIATGSAMALLRPGASVVASKIVPASTVGLIALRGVVVGGPPGLAAPSAERTLLIPAESRVLTIAAENRTLIV